MNDVHVYLVLYRGGRGDPIRTVRSRRPHEQQIAAKSRKNGIPVLLQ